MSVSTEHTETSEPLSPESDEKMDTGSESPPSLQDPPGRATSLEAQDTPVLRLQNPSSDTEISAEPNQKSSNVLRLNDNDRFFQYRDTKQESEEFETDPKRISVYDSPVTRDGHLDESLMGGMSGLKITDKVKLNAIENNVNESKSNIKMSKNELANPSEKYLQYKLSDLGVSPPKVQSTLTYTLEHPLMMSPEIELDYPDIVPERNRKKDDDKNCLSSADDDRFASDTEHCVPQKNTSKSNLYFENFAHDEQDLRTPDVVLSLSSDSGASKRTDGRRRIVPCFEDSYHLKESRSERTPHRTPGRPLDYSTPTPAEDREARAGRAAEGEESGVCGTPETDAGFHFGPVEWAESPSQLRSMSNIQLPVELSSNLDSEPESPEAVSAASSRALADPFAGHVSLHPARPAPPAPPGRRRVIVAEPQAWEEQLSPAGSVESLHSEEADLPPGGGRCGVDELSSDDDSRRLDGSEEGSPVGNDVRIPLPTGGHMVCDMKVIEPFMRVLSHGGYRADGVHLVVFSACYLPDSARKDYSYVVDNLFLYVLWTLERLVTDEYELIYLHGSASKHRLPNLHWLTKSYQLIDRRLRKSLKHLYLVHPTFWLKSIVFMSKPFISSKFSRKLSYVHSLAELYERVPVERTAIPRPVLDYDDSQR